MNKFFKRVLTLSLTLALVGGAGITEALPNNTNGSTPVKFTQQSTGWKIAGNLYLPKNYKAGKKYPAIITVHPGGGTLESQIATLNAIAKQRTAEANGAAPQYTKYVPEQNEITADTHRDMAEASEYYRTKRGQHKNAANKVLFTSFDKVLAYNSFAQIDTLLTQPLLLIAGTEAGSLWQSQLAYDKATGSKELYLIDGATHMDLYDIEKYVNQAVEKMNKFFKQNL